MADAFREYRTFITSQYQNSQKFLDWIDILIAKVKDIADIANGLNLAFDIDIAVGPQLDTLGVIIGLPRAVSITLPNLFFSWYDGHSPTETLGWGQGSWRGPKEKTSVMSLLPDDAYRQLLKFKILQNKWKGTADELYRAWDEIFEGEDLTLRIVDNQDMSISLYITGYLIPATIQYVLLGNYLPLKPAGVSITYVFSES